MICERCYTDTLSHTMSTFNTQTICLKCKEKETQHPDYERARDAESAEVRRGNYNFQGVGLPADLR
jgi:hypothetical protein